MTQNVPFRVYVGSPDPSTEYIRYIIYIIGEKAIFIKPKGIVIYLVLTGHFRHIKEEKKY